MSDLRIRTIAALLPLGFVGHFLQLAGEDFPWSVHALERYYVTPGWHLWLHPAVPAAIAVGVALAALGLAIRRTRPWLIVLIVLYAAHYLTYPFRIRNHMTLMFAELSMLGGVWLIAAIGRARDDERVDRWAVNGMAAVLCVTYTSAALHKVNASFLALDAERSAAVEGLTTFFVYGDLGSVPPRWVMAIAVYGTIVIEAIAPIVAWRVRRLRIPMILVLFAFHFPHVAAMDVADYPMIASAFYPALFSREQLARCWRNARPSALTIGGAAGGIALQLWFMPWLGTLTGFGIVVMAVWGWASAAMIRTMASPVAQTASAPAAEVG